MISCRSPLFLLALSLLTGGSVHGQASPTAITQQIEGVKASDVVRASRLAKGFAVVTPAGDGTLALGLALQPGSGNPSRRFSNPADSC